MDHKIVLRYPGANIYFWTMKAASFWLGKSHGYISSCIKRNKLVHSEFTIEVKI